MRPAPLIDIMTRDQRHAFMRMQHACQVLADPDALPRERRSAWVSLFRGYRALARNAPPGPLDASVRALGVFVSKVTRGPEAE